MWLLYITLPSKVVSWLSLLLMGYDRTNQTPSWLCWVPWTASQDKMSARTGCQSAKTVYGTSHFLTVWISSLTWNVEFRLAYPHNLFVFCSFKLENTNRNIRKYITFLLFKYTIGFLMEHPNRKVGVGRSTYMFWKRSLTWNIYIKSVYAL